MNEKPTCCEVGGSPSDGQRRLCGNSNGPGILTLVVSGSLNDLGTLVPVVSGSLNDLGGGFVMSATAAQWSAGVRCGSVTFLYAERSNIYRSKASKTHSDIEYVFE